MKKSAINTLLLHGGEVPVMFAGSVNTPADSRWKAAGPCGHRRIAHADIPRHANPSWSSKEEFTGVIRSDFEKYGKLVKQFGIKAE